MFTVNKNKYNCLKKASNTIIIIFKVLKQGMLEGNF